MSFKEDCRKTNPGLHLQYVKWGVQHLVAIDQCIDHLGSFSNLDLMDAIHALNSERAKLVSENAAYADADEIIASLEKL